MDIAAAAVVAVVNDGDATDLMWVSPLADVVDILAAVA